MASNITKNFKVKSQLRAVGMANGGVMQNTVDGVPTFTDQVAAAPGAHPYQPASLRAPQPMQPAVASAPAAQTMPTLSVAANPALTTEDMVEFNGITSAYGNAGPGFASSRLRSFADGGNVRGPGGPTEDKVGPVMLSQGEYVLPADTVQQVGKENLDALRDATHEFVPQHGGSKKSAKKMADGGYLSSLRNVKDDQPLVRPGMSAADLGGRIQRGIASVGGGSGFLSGFSSDAAAAQPTTGPQLGTPVPAGSPLRPAPVEQGVNIDRGRSMLRSGQVPEGYALDSRLSTPDAPIYSRANPNFAGDPMKQAEREYIGIGKPEAPKPVDPMESIRSALRDGARAPAEPQMRDNSYEINSRFDTLADKISKSYTEKGAGNRAKRLLELEAQRANALEGDARNISTLRGQDMAASSEAGRQRITGLETAARLAATDQATQAAQLKFLQEAQKSGREVEEKGFGRYNEAIQSMFIGEDGKPDAAEQEKFTSFLQASDPRAQEKFTSMAPQNQVKLLQDMKQAYEMNKARNKTAAAGGGATTQRADLPKDVREATWDDYWNNNLPLTDYLWSNLPGTNPNVVVSESGQPTLLSDAAVDAEGNWDADKLELIRSRTGKDHNGRSALRGK